MDHDQENSELDDEQKLTLFNEIRDVIITHYLVEKKRILTEDNDDKSIVLDTDPASVSEILDMLDEDKDDERLDPKNFQVKLIMLCEEWKEVKME